MKKRLLSFTLAAAMVFSLAGCRSAEPAATEAPTTIAATTAAAEGGEAEAAEGEETEAPAADFKIVSLQVLLPRVMRKSHRPTR